MTEKHIKALCSPVNQATVLGGMLSAHPFLARVGTAVSQSVSGSLRNIHGWIRMNERHCKNMRNLVSWEWRWSSLQEQETSWVPSNDLAFPSRQGWNHSLPCHHQITLQVITHDGRGGVFDHRSCGSAHECWTGKPNPATWPGFISSVVSPGLALFTPARFDLEGRGEGKGKRALAVMETSLKPKGPKPKGKSHRKACRSLRSSRPMARRAPTQAFPSASGSQQIFTRF